MSRRWWLWGVISVCIVTGVGYWFGLSSTPFNSTERANSSPARNSVGDTLTPTANAVNIRVPAPRLEPGKELVALASVPSATATKSSPPTRTGGKQLGSPKTTPEKPAPIGAGMAARDLVAGGEQKGTALDNVWESAVRQPVVVNALPASAPDWRVMGAVQRGDKAFLLVKFDGQPETRMFAIGDKLPGGGTVGWVKPNNLGVVYGKQESLDVPILQGQRDQEGLRLQQVRKPVKP
jgi:hypothetical protein